MIVITMYIILINIELSSLIFKKKIMHGSISHIENHKAIMHIVS
jgi:hypothetical protein